MPDTGSVSGTRLDSVPCLRSQPWQREQLRVTLASIGDAVIATDPEGRVSFMNGVGESLTGWTQPQASGRPLPEVFHIVNEHSREAAENPASWLEAEATPPADARATLTEVPGALTTCESAAC